MSSRHWEQAGPTLTELHRLSLLVQDLKSSVMLLLLLLLAHCYGMMSCDVCRRSTLTQRQCPKAICCACVAYRSLSVCRVAAMTQSDSIVEQ